jgi:uncharacterized membrane protein
MKMNRVIARQLLIPISVYATILVAFFLRVYRLADQNVWWDEGWSVWLSQHDVAWIAMRTAMDEHPPLHYWLLHFWNFIAGTNAFAGRFVSVAFGVLTIALIYRIGKKVGGTWVGLLAALFLATARFHIWWSQDIKNYTPSIFFVFVALWFALKIISDFTRSVQISDSKSTNSPSTILNYELRLTTCEFLYALFAALALYTHYLAALVLIALNLYWFGALITARKIENRKSKIINWLAANTLAAALFAPWFYVYLQNAATWSAAPAFDFTIFLKLVATVLPLGITTNIDDYAALTIALTAIATLGSFWIFTRRNGVSRITNYELRITNYELLFTLIVIFPPFLVYALALTPASFFAPKIQARYLLTLVPAYTLLLALGVQFLSRFSRYFAAFAILIVLGANVFVLNDYYATRRWRDEYATLANTINSFARQGDLVLLDTDQEWPTLLYYLRYPLDWLGASNGKPMTVDDADALARRALIRNDAVWLVAIPDALATDPQKILETRLARDLPKRFEATFDDKRLALYARDERDLIQVARENFKPQFLRVMNVDAAQLLGFDLPVRAAYAGETVRVVTYWDSHAGNAQINSQTIHIPSGERVRVQTDVAIPPDARDNFSITLNTRELARVSIEPRRATARGADIANRVDYRFGDAIHLVGYNLPMTIYRASDTIALTLFWRADRPIEKNYTVFAHLRGEQFNPKQNNPLWGQVDRAPMPPPNAWRVNEIISDAYRLVIDPDAPPGKYKIEIGMYDAATGTRLQTDQGDSVIVGEIEIRGR